MPTEIDRSELMRLVAAGAQLVDVLPREEYEDQHLPGALSFPLRRIETESAMLDRDRAVVVYCWDAA